MYGRRILILAPHPDDEVVGCAAAAGRATDAGAKVFVHYLTTGVPAADLLWPWQRPGHGDRIGRRKAEAELAAAFLGITPTAFENTPTRMLKGALDDTREAILGNIDRRRIDTLWVPAYEGGHQDHDAANALAATLAERVAVHEFAEYNMIGGKVRSQRFAFPNGTETEIIMSQRERRRKRRALGFYASERGNLRHIQTGRESFRPLARYDYAKPPHDGPAFYQRFQWVPFRHPRIDFTRPDEVSEAILDFQRSL